jgi:hypothetical protein
MLWPLTLGRTIVSTELVQADVLLSNNDIIDVGLNECLLRVMSCDIPKLQVLRCVLGPIRALAAKWPTLAAGAAATWRRCHAARPVRLDRQGSRLRRTFRGCNLRLYLFHWPTRIRISHVGRMVR